MRKLRRCKLRVTAKQLAEKLKVDYVAASSLIKVMLSRGAAKEVDSIKSPSGKGKPSRVYELPPQWTLDLSENAEAA